MKAIKLCVFLLLGLFVSACSSIPLSTMYQLSKANLMTMDPNHVGAAVRIPNQLREGKDGVKIQFSSWIDDEKDKADVLSFKLERVSNAEDLQAIKPFEKPLFTTMLYKISAGDVEKLKQYRQAVKRKKEALGSRLHGSFSVGATYCRTEKISDRPVLVSNWIKVSKTSGLLPLFINNDLGELIKKHPESGDDVLPLCRE